MVDKFVILQNCQFEKNNFQNRFNIGDKWHTLSTNRGLEPIINKKYVNHVKDWLKIKNNLKEIIATVAIIGTIGGGFIKYGEIMSKIDSIDPSKVSTVKNDMLILQKEVELLKVQMKELRASNSNPLAR